MADGTLDRCVVCGELVCLPQQGHELAILDHLRWHDVRSDGGYEFLNEEILLFLDSRHRNRTLPKHMRLNGLFTWVLVHRALGREVEWSTVMIERLTDPRTSA